MSEHMAKHRLQQLQTKQEAVLLRRDQLLAAEAQVELKKLRRCVASLCQSLNSG